MRAFKAGVNGSDEPTLTDQANSTFLFGFGSGSPVVTSNGTDPDSAIVWVVDSPDSNGDGKNAWLGAFDATPQPKAGGGTKMHEIWSGTIGTAVKFTTAATANGMVYVGTRDGDIYGFGITSGAALKSGGTATFADTPVHSALHEGSHFICMDHERRAALDRDAGGDDPEEAAVCYLQVLLAGELPDVGGARLMRDMDAWGYSFRLGSTQAWYQSDAEDARGWLQRAGIIDASGALTGRSCC